MTVEEAVRRLLPIEQQLVLTDQEALKALRTVCHAALFSEMDKDPCRFCDDEWFRDFPNDERKFCHICGRKLSGDDAGESGI